MHRDHRAHFSGPCGHLWGGLGQILPPKEKSRFAAWPGSREVVAMMGNGIVGSRPPKGACPKTIEGPHSLTRSPIDHSKPSV